MRKTKEQKQKTNKGITLIALIITIIVMLILVAVTITIAVNGGLFEYAGRAGKETNEAIKNEQLLAEGIINGQTIDDIVGIAVKDDWYGAPAVELPIDEDGNYHIKTCAELAKFASMVNDGNDFAGKTVYLDKNLDLQGNEDKQWTPIGVDERHTFNGIFDGKNHFISGIYIDGNMTYAGLFGIVGNYNDTNIIKNLGIKNSYINVNGYAGGIAANNMAIIQNCYNEANLIGDNKAGGIAGFNDYKIFKCYNTGTIKGNNSVGGICGDHEGGEEDLYQCYNLGNVYGLGGTYNDEVSGIACVGYVGDCYNLGTVSGTAQRISGIGTAGAINSYNVGNVDGAASSYLDMVSIGEKINSYYESETLESENAKTSAFMKTQEFVDLLNNGRTGSEAIWKMDTNNINNGYPILSWQ